MHSDLLFLSAEVAVAAIVPLFAILPAAMATAIARQRPAAQRVARPISGENGHD